MDQARLFIAIVLSFLVFFAWEIFFADRTPVPPPVNEKSEALPEPFEPPPELPKKKAAEMPVLETAADRRARRIVVDTPLYKAEISEKGGVFTSLVLKEYRESVESGASLKQLVHAEATGGTVRTRGVAGFLSGMEEAVFVTDSSAYVSAAEQARSVSFVWRSTNGVVVEKRYRFYPSTYLIDFEVNVQNTTDSAFSGRIGVVLRNQIPEDQRFYGFEGPSALIDNHLEQVKIKDIEDTEKRSGKLQWIALEDRYFLSSLVPMEPVSADMTLKTDEDGYVENAYWTPDDPLSAGMQQEHHFKLYFGPKSLKILSGMGHGLNKAIYFGWFDIIAKPCLWFMNFIYRFIPNYGIAIIILTIVTKIILWPLGNKSYKSMNEMKKIQPLMAEIREKYKDDKKKMNEELMGLYRVYKINPLGGCLPMIVQIPVFIALYRMLYESIELRHAPFMLWINDLSAPDRLFRFDFSIPLMQPPYGIPVLTLVMGGTMFLQQKLSPPPGDPAQAKMMMLMPVIFTFIFINFSSGLVLYWLVNNILSIAQQYYITQKNA